MRRILIIRGRVRFFFLLTLATHAFGAGIGSYAHLVAAGSAGAVRDGVRVTYLGTNGYQFEFKGHALLVDPYFSRVDLSSVALGSRIQPNASRINDGLGHLAAKAGRDFGDARTFRSPVGCPGCDGKNTGASHSIGGPVSILPNAREFHPARQ